jgi:protein O-mannosyl-transferase
VSKSKRPAQKPSSPSVAGRVTQDQVKDGRFTIPHPLWWLALAALVVYFPAFFMKFTELDDSIFIRDFHAYNEDIGNLFTSFQRGLFDAVKDPYYRPLFMDSIVLNYQVSGDNVMSYHVVNVLLHIIAVALLYRLFLRLNIKHLPAFMLTLVFAVHPVLSQAIAWIPGRNDTLLAIFVFSFFLFSIDYTDTGKIGSLLLSFLFLLLAYFTKETAVFAAPAAFVLLVIVLRKNWRDMKIVIQYGMWVACFAVWFFARSVATVQSSGIASMQALTDFIKRLPVIIQYLGKIFLPFNLSVFPTQEDTVYYYGIVAVLLLGTAIFLYKNRNMRMILGGFAVFLLFLAPALLVPLRLNEQTFEHRLYLPLFGILLVVSQTALLQNKLAEKKLFFSGMVVCVILTGINFKHQQNFSDPLTFWTSAAETSPNSAYANMMLAARLDKDQVQRSEALFRKAYRLDPTQKYLNFYIGDMLQKKDSVLASEPYLLAEKNASGYYQCDFLLARVAMEKKDLPGAINYLKTYLKTDTKNGPANTNLLLLYLDTHQPDSARAQARNMQQRHLDVPPQLQKQLGL